MKFILYFSETIIPVTIFLILAHGITKKTAVYDCFAEGAKQGLKTVVGICPTLIGLMVGVGVLRASGFLDFVTTVLQPAAKLLHFPKELIPCIVVRMFSSSAATGLILDIFRQYGPDSQLGLIASVSNACTETIFYTMSVYFMAASVKKTRWTLSGALLAAFSGIAASVILVDIMTK